MDVQNERPTDVVWITFWTLEWRKLNVRSDVQVTLYGRMCAQWENKYFSESVHVKNSVLWRKYPNTFHMSMFQLVSSEPSAICYCASMISPNGLGFSPSAIPRFGTYGVVRGTILMHSMIGHTDTQRVQPVTWIFILHNSQKVTIVIKSE